MKLGSKQEVIDHVVRSLAGNNGKGVFEAEGIPPIEIGAGKKVYVVMDWDRYVAEGRDPMDYCRAGVDVVRKVRSALPDFNMRADIKFVSAPPKNITLGDLADELSGQT